MLSDKVGPTALLMLVYAFSPLLCCFMLERLSLCFDMNRQCAAGFLEMTIVFSGFRGQSGTQFHLWTLDMPSINALIFLADEHLHSKPNSTAPHVSLHRLTGLFADVGVESDATTSTTDSEHDGQTFTAFGDVSLTDEYILRPAPRPLNRLRLKVKCPSFPKKRTSLQGQPGPTLQNDVLVSSPLPLSPSFFVNALKNSLRSGKQRAAQRSAVESGIPSLPATPPVLRELTSSSSSPSSQSFDCEPGQSVIVKTVPEVSEPAKGWRKLPRRLPIPKWDVDD
ncbi:uncharacterized protein EDB91DRAFT_1350413 [Suillus paluster]|uniref:uncharacterized protein n=1 Tax=Suillus paluster TaxID=48578 RepID=UPI001B8719E2|nr:uncharacterized protein EDB91DRAFT_1350413 [Suillus paluster]KAG1726960.1 hypothetical protein EDB91DRAFT_1350413 [Suillus paluster]